MIVSNFINKRNTEKKGNKGIDFNFEVHCFLASLKQKTMDKKLKSMPLFPFYLFK